MIECLICNKELKYISNTHLKTHGITQQEYIDTYHTPLFTEDLLAVQKERREATIKEKYSSEEIKYLKGEKAKQAKEKKYGMSLSEIQKIKYQESEVIHRELAKYHPLLPDINKDRGRKIKSFYENLSADEHEIHKKNRLEKRIATNMKKYGVPFAQAAPEVKAKQKETIINKYGGYDVFQPKIRDSHNKKYGVYSNFFPHFSLESQELFMELEKWLPEDISCYYATNGAENKSNEYQIYYGGAEPVRFLDFYIPVTNTWIEFDEAHHKHNCMHKYDKKREKEISGKLKGVSLLRISEEEWNINKEAVLDKCVLFIMCADNDI